MHKYFSEEITEVSEKEQAYTEISYLLFAVNKETFGIDINDITVIMQKPELRNVPDMPKYIAGLTHYSGRVYPVMDLRKRFQISHKEYSERTPLILLSFGNLHAGIIVDEILEVKKVYEKDLLEAPKERTGFYNRFVTGIIDEDKTLTYIIDNSALFVNEQEYIQEMNSQSI